jgi:arginyl-tRNA synthetase
VPFPDELYQGEEVKEIARVVEERLVEDTHHAFSVSDLTDQTFLRELSRVAVEETVRATKAVLESVCKVRFDVWTFEHTLHERGDVQKVLDDLKKKGLTYEQDGALWFASTKFGDDKDRVLVRQNGEVTYFVPDIAYHRDKFRRGFFLIADFWGADHHGYVARLRHALEALGEDVSRLTIVVAQMVLLVENGEQKKMSKRAGTAVPLHEVVAQAGLSPARFFLTLQALSSQMDFDLNLVHEQSERNPVYYVQYAHVRLASLLRKAKERNILDGDLLPRLGERVPLTHTAEVALMRNIFRFPEVVEDVSDSWDVQRLPHYALELAKSVHLFYDAVPVLAAETDELKSARLTLALAAKTALGNALDLLGVEKRDIM